MIPAVIIAAARTAIGTSRRGTLASLESRELAKPIVTAAIDRSGLDPTDFDDLVLAEVMQGGGDIARYVAVDLGLTGLPGLAVNRQCASSLSAISLTAGQIAAGMSRAVLAGGGAMIGRRSIIAIGPPRRAATICIKSSLLEDTNTGAGHITADRANHLLVLPIPGGAKQPTCAADSSGTSLPRRSRVQPANGVTEAWCGASLRLAMATLQR